MIPFPSAPAWRNAAGCEQEEDIMLFLGNSHPRYVACGRVKGKVDGSVAIPSRPDKNSLNPRQEILKIKIKACSIHGKIIKVR